MPLRLSIENVSALPDGGPISYTISGKRGIDIGRDQYLDWVLPDPDRVVSGKHCEIRYRDGGYWLRDVSTNGTLVNESPRRLQEPHRLRDGDRIDIGHYVIRVEVEGELEGEEDGAAAAAAGPAGGDGGLWGASGAAPPVDPGSLKVPSAPYPVLAADPLDWVADLPAVTPAPQAGAPPGATPHHGIWGLEDIARPEAAPVPPPAEWRSSTLPPAEPSGPHVPPAAPAFAPPRPAPAAVAAPAPSPVPAASSAQPAASSGETGAEFIRRFAEGAGLDPSAIAVRDAGDLAKLLGTLMQLCAGNVGQLLAARAQSKSAMRSTNQTLIQVQGNNPLRFAPTSQDALGILFGRQTRSYLDAHSAFEQSFEMLKCHQIDTFSSIQEAIQILLADLDPAAIERVLGGDAKKGGLFKNDKALKARLWDEFAMRWKTKTGAYDSGLFGAFMRVFGEAYDRKGE